MRRKANLKCCFIQTMRWRLVVEPCQLFTEVPEPLGVLITQCLGLRSLDSAVRVVKPSLSVHTLVHSAEDRGLRPRLRCLDERVDEHKKISKDPQLLLNVSAQLSGNNPGVEGVDIDPSAPEPVGQLPGEQDVGQLGLTIGRVGAVLGPLPTDIVPLNFAIFVSQRTDCDYPGPRSSLVCEACKAMGEAKL